MSFQIERGLFLLDFADHHAILGVPIDADTQTIRKRYLKIARRLHPDSCVSESEDDKQRASQFLSKFVNPAWEKLSQEKDRTEYDLVLKLKGEQAARQSTHDLSKMAQDLAAASHPDHFYHTSIKGLAERQYEHLDKVLDVTGQLSELNLVYLIRKQHQGGISTQEPKRIYTGSNIPDSSQSSTQPVATKSAPSPARESIAEQYCRRAEGYMAKNNFAQAVLELRDALQQEPKNGRCHALLGVVYLRQNQTTMAKIHFNKALELDPQNQMALDGKNRLDQISRGTAGKSVNNTATGAKAAPKPNKPNDKSGGGLFGLFGGKK